MVFPTGHAVGLRSADGLEVLIHIGLDTVRLAGKGVDIKVAKGDTVKTGDVLVEFDPALIRKEGYSLVTPIIVTNTTNYADVLPYPRETVKHGQELLTAVEATKETVQ